MLLGINKELGYEFRVGDEVVVNTTKLLADGWPKRVVDSLSSSPWLMYKAINNYSRSILPIKRKVGNRTQYYRLNVIYLEPADKQEVTAQNFQALWR